jgi:PAS domain S-box-containing protein
MGMTTTAPVTAGLEGRGGPLAGVWFPGPRVRAWSLALVWLFFVAMTVLAAYPGRSFGSAALLTVLNLAFFALGSAFVAWVVARTFLARRAAELLVLGAGVVAFGATSVVASVVGGGDPDVTVAIHNVGVLLAGGCHLVAAALAGRRGRPLRRPRAALLAVYGGALAAVGLVAAAAGGGDLPTFFVQGQGGTPVRQAVLACAITSFGLASTILWAGNADTRSAFRHWYATGLGLVAVGLYGVLLQASFGSALSWLGRAAQYLGSASMVLAAIASVREAHARAVPVDLLLREAEARYRALFENLAEGFFLAEVLRDPSGGPADLRFLDVNPALERLLHRRRGEIVGRSLRELVPEADPRWIDDLGRVGLTREPLRTERHSASLGGFFAALAYSPAPGQIACLLTDVTELRKAERRMADRDAIVKLAMDAALAVVFEWDVVHDRVTRLQSVEEALPAMGGQALEDVVAVVHPADRESFRADLRTALGSADGRYRGEYRIVRPDGEVRWLSESGRVEFDGEHRPLRLMGVALDVTDRRQAGEDLQAANARLREQARHKDEFLRMLSHELRNPLAPIRNSAYVLRHAPPGSSQARRAGEVVERQAAHLTRLVDDLLDVTRIARGKIELRRSRLELRELLLRAAEDHRPELEERGVRFRIDLPPGELWADADATRLVQVTGNLLHNAAKFTHRGDEVTLSLKAEDGEVVLRVHDTGVGIDAAVLPRLFEPFVQGDRSLARTEGGLGLGLALVRGIAELHGGSACAASAGPGQGADFTVRLPVLAPAAAPVR